jgi:DMSO/TMAO reductase YedYZ molybdopterin-dependent catalytic subunit
MLRKLDAPEREWSGYRVLDLIDLAFPLPEARYVEMASGDFVTVLPLDVIVRQDVFS